MLCPLFLVRGRGNREFPPSKEMPGEPWGVRRGTVEREEKVGEIESEREVERCSWIDLLGYISNQFVALLV